MKNLLICSLLSLAALTACGGEKAAEEKAAAGQTAAADAQDNANEGGETAAAKLGTAANAPWKSYQCADGKIAEARYFLENGKPAAEVKAEGVDLTLVFSDEGSNDDLNSFSNGRYTWNIGNEVGTDYYREHNGFLVAHEEREIMGEATLVDNIVVRNCEPV